MRVKTFTSKGCVLFTLFIIVSTLLFFHKSFYTPPPRGNYFVKTGNNRIETAVAETASPKNTNYTNDNEIAESVLNTGGWIQVDQDIYIFSAYWETRVQPYSVRIIGIGLESWRDVSHITCALWYDTGIVTTKAKIKEIPENHGMKHTALLYLCDTDKMPLQVTLFVNSQQEVKWLKVKRIEPEDSRRKLALCIQPLYGKFANNNLNIAEFVSYYQLLNASHFTFYDYKADASVISILSELSKSGVSIDLLKWNLPDQAKDAWNFAQLASIVDCVYRHTQSHEYAFFVDVDEFLVPLANVSFQELIEKLDRKGKWCSYMFRQSFFCLQLSDDPDSNHTDTELFTLKKVLRAKKIWKPYARTKSIVRTFSVDVPGIHYLWSTIPGKKEIMVVSPDVALLHHYRAGINEKECNDNVIDKSAVKYGSLIMNSGPIEVWRKWNASLGHVK